MQPGHWKRQQQREYAQALDDQIRARGAPRATVLSPTKRDPLHVKLPHLPLVTASGLPSPTTKLDEHAWCAQLQSDLRQQMAVLADDFQLKHALVLERVSALERRVASDPGRNDGDDHMATRTHVTTLLQRLHERMATIESKLPTRGQTADDVERWAADVERRLLTTLRDTLQCRDRLQDEHRETNVVMGQLTTESLARVYEVSQSRIQALESQLLTDRRERSTFEEACHMQWQQLHMAVELIKSQCDACEKTEHLRTAKWMDAQAVRAANEWRQCHAHIAQVSESVDVHVQALQAQWREQASRTEVVLANLEKVVAAEIQKRSRDMAELQASRQASLEKLHAQWTAEAATRWQPYVSAISSLETQIKALDAAHFRAASLDGRLADQQQAFVLAQQDALSRLQMSLEARLWQVEALAKASSRETQQLQVQLRGLLSERAPNCFDQVSSTST